MVFSTLGFNEEVGDFMSALGLSMHRELMEVDVPAVPVVVVPVCAK